MEARLKAVETQTDKNIAATEIVNYLEKKLEKLESEIKKDFDPEATKLFEEAASAWRKYRAAQAAFESNSYRGGTFASLAYSDTYMTITKDRLKTLSD